MKSYSDELITPTNNISAVEHLNTLQTGIILDLNKSLRQLLIVTIYMNAINAAMLAAIVGYTFFK